MNFCLILQASVGGNTKTSKSGTTSSAKQKEVRMVTVNELKVVLSWKHACVCVCVCTKNL